jgi:primosomal protein N'
MLARLAVNIPAISGIFDYAIPPELAPHIQAGCLVVAPFGVQTVQGIVIELTDSSPIQNPKTIIDLLDPAPVLTPPQIALAIRLAETHAESACRNRGVNDPNRVVPTGGCSVRIANHNYEDKTAKVATRLITLLRRTRSPARTPDRQSLRQSGLAQDCKHAGQKRRAFLAERPAAAEGETKAHSRRPTVGHA